MTAMDDRDELYRVTLLAIRRQAVAMVSLPDADDLAQDVMLELAGKYSRLDRPGDLGRVAQQILVFKVWNLRRSNGRRQIQDIDGLALPDPRASPELCLLWREELAQVKKIALDLGPETQIIFKFLLDGHSPGEIVRALNVPNGTVWSRISRTREEIRKRLR